MDALRFIYCGEVPGLDADREEVERTPHPTLSIWRTKNKGIRLVSLMLHSAERSFLPQALAQVLVDAFCHPARLCDGEGSHVLVTVIISSSEDALTAGLTGIRVADDPTM